MNKNEIKIGQEYAHSRSADHRRYRDVRRVKVTGEAFKRERLGRWDKDNSWYVPCIAYRPGGSEVEVNIKTRQIKEPWADYEAFVKEEEARQAQANVRRANEQLRRIEQAREVIADLRAAGVPAPIAPGFSSISDKDAAVWRSHGFKVESKTYDDGREVLWVAEPLWSQIEQYIKSSVSLRLSFDDVADLAKRAAR